MGRLLSFETDDKLFQKVKQDDKAALSRLFDLYYIKLCLYAQQYVSPELAEEISQDAFIYIWEKRAQLQFKTSLKSYLYTLVRNDALDHIKTFYNKSTLVEDTSLYVIEDRLTPFDHLHNEELEKLIQTAISELPEKCSIVFNLSRSSEMSHKEIAESLNVSIKTVENQIGIALKKIKGYIAENTN